MHPFIDYIASIEPPTNKSRNIYALSEQCRHNLSVYIEQMLELRPTILFIGEAPGYLGCGVTGVPFTDEYTLATHPFFSGKGYEFGNPPAHEATAKCVWSCIDEVVPMMWNIYPFHPFGAHEQSNRKPNGSEIRNGEAIAEQLMSLFPIDSVYAIGRTAQAFAKTAKYIRHPSHGGQTLFKESCNAIL